MFEIYISTNTKPYINQKLYIYEKEFNSTNCIIGNFRHIV